MSQHLAGVRAGGGAPEARASVYSPARPELLDLLCSAERLLEATGEQVTLCPVFGQDTSETSAIDTDVRAVLR